MRRIISLYTSDKPNYCSKNYIKTAIAIHTYMYTYVQLYEYIHTHRHIRRNVKDKDYQLEVQSYDSIT